MRKLTIGGNLYSVGAEFPDEGLIMAYVDGELDEEGRHYVENLLARSTEAREIAELMRSTSALLRPASFDDRERDPAGVITPPMNVPENRASPPASLAVKQARLCRPKAGEVMTRTRV